MTYIFDKLKALQRCVILFDEVEEFCLDREDKTLTMESRMLTTAMLTQVCMCVCVCVYVCVHERGDTHDGITHVDHSYAHPGMYVCVCVHL
jgi:hypothetical protein